MRINVNYFDQEIELSTEKVFSIEIENKSYFFRFVNSLYHIMNGEGEEDIQFYDDGKEINCNGKIQVISNYFQFDFNSRKVQTSLLKYVNQNIDDADKNDLSKYYSNLVKEYKKILNKLDITVNLEVDEEVDSLAKLLKVSIPVEDNLMNNLFRIIDLEKELKMNVITFFINLKQYLSKEELIELYKYATYNLVPIVLIDSFHYEITETYESKLMIDDSLEEICYNINE